MQETPYLSSNLKKFSRGACPQIPLGASAFGTCSRGPSAPSMLQYKSPPFSLGLASFSISIYQLDLPKSGLAALPDASPFMAPPAWPMYMASYMPRPLTQPPFIQAQFEELARQNQEKEACD